MECKSFDVFRESRRMQLLDHLKGPSCAMHDGDLVIVQPLPGLA
jgi:hypothetical protein